MSNHHRNRGLSNPTGGAHSGVRSSQRPSQRPSQRSSPHHSPLSSQNPSQRPSPIRSERSGVPIGGDDSKVTISTHYSPYDQLVEVPAALKLPESRQHISRVLGKSRVLNTDPESVLLTSGKVFLKINIISDEC